MQVLNIPDLLGRPSKAQSVGWVFQIMRYLQIFVVLLSLCFWKLPHRFPEQLYCFTSPPVWCVSYSVFPRPDLTSVLILFPICILFKASWLSCGCLEIPTHLTVMFIGIPGKPLAHLFMGFFRHPSVFPTLIFSGEMPVLCLWSILHFFPLRQYCCCSSRAPLSSVTLPSSEGISQSFCF